MALRSGRPFQQQDSDSDNEINMADEAAAARKTAERNLGNMLKMVQPIAEVGHDKWEQQLKLVAFTYEWHESILTANPGPGAEAPPDTEKHKADVKCAYTLLRHTAGLDDLVENIPLGEAQLVFKAINEHFHRKTTSGFKQATLTFMTSSMEKEEVDLTGFYALISRRAKRLQEVGGVAGEREKLNVFLSGLLPEFNEVKILLEMEKFSNLPQLTNVFTILPVEKGLKN